MALSAPLTLALLAALAAPAPLAAAPAGTRLSQAQSRRVAMLVSGYLAPTRARGFLNWEQAAPDIASLDQLDLSGEEARRAHAPILEAAAAAVAALVDSSAAEPRAIRLSDGQRAERIAVAHRFLGRFLDQNDRALLDAAAAGAGALAAAAELERRLNELPAATAGGIEEGEGGRPFIHARVTDRSHAGIFGGYDDMLQSSNLVRGKNGAFPSFDREAVIRGERSVLSQGEGESDFIERLLLESEARERKKRFGRRRRTFENICAVDAAYGVSEQVYEAQGAPLPVRDPIVRLRPAMKRFPGNFRAATFQEMELRAEDGSLLQFDDVVSSWSFLFVLAKSPGDAERMLRRVLLHLKPGGTFRAWPAEETPGAAAILAPILEKLEREGLIRNHNVPDARFAPSIVMIQKA